MDGSAGDDHDVKKSVKYPEFPRVSWNTADKADRIEPLSSQQYVGMHHPPHHGDFDDLDVSDDALDKQPEFYDTPR